MPDINRFSANQEDDRDEASDAESVITVPDEEFPQHFQERNNRLFHSHGSTLPYPLPADTPEQNRLDRLHNVVKFMMHGSNHFGPVAEVLDSRSGVRRRGLDLCTGNGTWVLEMAREFQYVKFYGVDIVPIASRFPPSNVQFEIHDVTTPLRFPNEYFDLIHYRHSLLAIPNHAPFVAEVARMLRPGGLFISADWESNFEMHDGSDRELSAPGLSEYFNSFNNIMNARNVNVNPRIWELVVARPYYFTNIDCRQAKITINLRDQDAISRRMADIFKNIMIGFVDSTQDAFTTFGGYSVAQFNTIKANLCRDLETVPGISFVYRAVQARKVMPVRNNHAHQKTSARG